MKLIFIFFSFYFVGCSAQERKIIFNNNSDTQIDSINIGISSKDTYNIKHVNVRPNDTIINKIPINVPKSNNHDIAVFVTIFINGIPPIHEYSYNDLASYLTHDYCIILNKEKKIIWQICK